MARTALITGISGQDGAYLARLLLGKGYRVCGTVRSRSSPSLRRLAELAIEDEIEFVELDSQEPARLARELEAIGPDEIYNLAAQSSVRKSYEEPVRTAELNALGPARLLEAIRESIPNVRYYQASTSEMFGRVEDASRPADEHHAFHPRSPYGVSKLFAHHLTINYREAFGLYAVSGILFNHESPLRGRDYVTRKITVGLAEVRHGRRDVISLGNVDARRDWGFAGDYVEGMWLMLQQPTPTDFVLSTGRNNSIADFAELAAGALGFRLEWDGSGSERIGVDAMTGRTIIAVDEALLRPADIDTLSGDSRKARKLLGWSAQASLDQIVAMMAEADERRVCDGTLAF